MTSATSSGGDLPLLRLRGVVREYPAGDGVVAVLKGIDNAQLIQMIAAEATQALKIASHGFRCVRFLPA